jgi:hypothetical protein
LLTIDRGQTSWLIVNICDWVLVVIVFLQRVLCAESLYSQHLVGIAILLSDSYPQSYSTGHFGALNKTTGHFGALCSIQTTSITAKNLQKPHNQTTHYWNTIQLTHNINIISDIVHKTRIQEVDELSERRRNRNQPFPTFSTGPSTSIMMTDNQEILEGIENSLLHSRHLTKLQEFLQQKYN